MTAKMTADIIAKITARQSPVRDPHPGNGLIAIIEAQQVSPPAD